MPGLSPAERKSLILSVGTHRAGRPYSPSEVAHAFSRALEEGATLQDCADIVGFEGTSMVSRFLRLLKLPSESQHLVDWGQTGSTISFTAASELSRLKTEEDKSEAIRATLEHHLSTSEVKELVQARLRSGKPMKVCIEELLKRRPTVERRYLFVGAVTAEPLKKHLREMTQRDRDSLLHRVLERTYEIDETYSARLGTDRFTIVGGEELSRTIHSKDDFESLINTELQRETGG